MFKIGDKIVYPMHGAGTIDSIEEKEILGEKRQYFVMRMPIGDMKAMVPVGNLEEVGVREIISLEEMKGIIDILEGDRSKMPQNWNRRYRANMDKIKSGDIYEIAAVVRNLMLLDGEKGLSTGERKMLNDAKQMLVSEMALVCEYSVEEAEEALVEAVNTGLEQEEIERNEEEERLEEDKLKEIEEEIEEEDDDKVEEGIK